MTVMPRDRSARMPVPDFVHPERSSRRRSAQAFHSLAAALRLSIGWVFLWAFLDRLLALGFATGRNPKTGAVDRFGDAAWINGGSPTEGFLLHGTGTGIALIAGITMRIATAAGATLLVFMWSAALPPANNPFMDDHIVYALVLVALALDGAGKTLGLGVWWERIPMVQRYGILK